uniref:Uncharacterized protein n=1 Tax=Zea mays TaxID=4577 RepID=B6U1K0_MAIZE|nr:hypothetical protein [Zea mays]
MADEPAINQSVGLRWKPSSGETGSAGEGTTAVTTAAGGPTGIRRDTISSTLSGSPESSASTVPSAAVADPPGEPQGARHLHGPVPEEDALHASLHHHAHRLGGRRLLHRRVAWGARACRHGTAGCGGGEGAKEAGAGGGAGGEHSGAGEQQEECDAGWNHGLTRRLGASPSLTVWWAPGRWLWTEGRANIRVGLKPRREYSWTA